MKWFCWQYYDKLRYIHEHPEEKAAKKYRDDIRRIETALHIVSSGAVYDVLKKHITNRNLPYERLGTVPLGRRQFYQLRTRFYRTLNSIF